MNLSERAFRRKNYYAQDTLECRPALGGPVSVWVSLSSHRHNLGSSISWHGDEQRISVAS